MKNIQHLFVFAILSSLFLSCEKEEKPIAPYDRGDVQTIAINTSGSAEYGDQVFFDLATHSMVKTVKRTDWDLAFEASAAGEYVLLNYANGMQVAQTGITHFESVDEATNSGLEYKWDQSSGNEDSIALRDWIISGTPTQEVYIIDRGVSPTGSDLGHKKIQILSVDAHEFTIRYANLDDSQDNTISVPKNTSKNYVYLNFDLNAVVEIEPDKDQWDLLFTQYTHTFYDQDPVLAYSVNGALINPSQCLSVDIWDVPFANITMDNVATHPLNDSVDGIGYDWKYYDFADMKYNILPSNAYLIQGKEGFYYKLRFIDFYSDLGQKGHPKFEYEQL